MRIETRLIGFDGGHISVSFDAWYLIGGTKNYPATLAEDGVTWWAEIEGSPRTVTPRIDYTTATVDPDSDSTVTVELRPE